MKNLYQWNSFFGPCSLFGNTKSVRKPQKGTKVCRSTVVDNCEIFPLTWSTQPKISSKKKKHSFSLLAGPRTFTAIESSSSRVTRLKSNRKINCIGRTCRLRAKRDNFSGHAVLGPFDPPPFSCARKIRSFCQSKWHCMFSVRCYVDSSFTSLLFPSSTLIPWTTGKDQVHQTPRAFWHGDVLVVTVSEGTSPTTGFWWRHLWWSFSPTARRKWWWRWRLWGGRRRKCCHSGCT